MTTLYVVTAFHTTGHGPMTSVVLVTGDAKKALDTARNVENMAYEFDDSSGNGIFISRMIPEVTYDHLPGDISRDHGNPTNSDAIVCCREWVPDYSQEHTGEGYPLHWRERFFNGWDRNRP